jgi:Arc/MetJ family transcription regulator
LTGAIVYYSRYKGLTMRTTIVLDDDLVAEAFKYAKDIHTKKELVETALQEFVRNRKLRDIRELRGKVLFWEGYDHKAMRASFRN